MRKILLSFVTLFAVSAAQAASGDDLTAKYLKNADFSQGAIVVEGNVCTYDYDMPVSVGEEGLYGQQVLEGWTALNPSNNIKVMESSSSADRGDGTNARAAALFAIGSEATMGGAAYTVPTVNSAGGASGNVLGMVAVWGAVLQYTQDVTLPAGTYTLCYKVFNGAGTGAASKNHCGFIADGASYTCKETTWTVGEWQETYVTFTLAAETAGVVSVGYTGPAGSGSMPHLFFESVKLYEGLPAHIAKALVDELKESELLPLIEAGDELNVSTTAAWAVYNDPNATLEQVQQAIAQQKALNEAGMTDMTDYFIKNAHFAAGKALDGGVCTYDYDVEKNAAQGAKYFGMQPVDQWVANAPNENARAAGLFAVGSPATIWVGGPGFEVPAAKANGSTEGNLFGFISVWSANSYYSQSATLPAGTYTITIPTYNGGGTGAVAKNQCGFVTEEGEEFLAETTTFPVGKWSNETIKFTLDEETRGEFRIGYTAANAGSGSMPHLFVDEFTLKFNGILNNPSMYALKAAQNSAYTYMGIDKHYEIALMAALEEAAEAADELVENGSSDEAVNVAAVNAINAAIDALNASIAAYDKFEAFIAGDLTAAIKKYANADLADFSDALSDLKDEYTDAWEEGEYTTEQIDAAIAALQPAIVEAITKAFEAAQADTEEHNIDITPILAQNLSFDNKSVEGWTCTRTAGKFESQVSGVCEVWHNNPVDFTASTTLANMPAGVYEISAPGWFRDAGDMAAGFDDYQSGSVVAKSYIIANSNQTEMLNQGDEHLQAAEEDEMHNGNVESAGIWLPNGQGTAAKVFYESDIDVRNTVTTALAKPGDLTIGFKGEGFDMGTWTVWGAISVVYKGNDKAMMLVAQNEALEALINTASTLDANDFVPYVTKATNDLQSAIGKGEDAMDIESVDVKDAAIDGLTAAIAYAAESQSLFLGLESIYTLYAEYLVQNVESSDTQFPELLAQIGACLAREDAFESNEQIKKLTASLPVDFVAYVQHDAIGTASLEEPADLSVVILNADMEDEFSATPNHTHYWTVRRVGGSEGYSEGIYEFYNVDTFDISQSIKGLAEGYYRVSVQTFYRAGGNQDVADSLAVYGSEYGRNAVLYANNVATELKNPFERLEGAYTDPASTVAGEGSEPAVKYGDIAEFYIPNDRLALKHYFENDLYWNTLDVYLAEGADLTIGLRKDAHVGGDWCPFDNFRLHYLGTTAPDAIERVAAGSVNATQPAAIYDLQGRRVQKTVRGLYIIGGKKYVVK